MLLYYPCFKKHFDHNEAYVLLSRRLGLYSAVLEEFTLALRLESQCPFIKQKMLSPETKHLRRYLLHG